MVAGFLITVAQGCAFAASILTEGQVAADHNSNATTSAFANPIDTPVPIPHTAAYMQAAKPSPAVTSSPLARFGADAHIGIGGIGFDLAVRTFRNFNLRAGGDFFNYRTTFEEQGANVNADLGLRSGHASVDWYPFRNRIRVSPLLVFANTNHGSATAQIPAGQTITLDGADYISSYADPLHGSGSVNFRKVSPGLTVGIGNIARQSGGHLSFPLEIGLYYAGQPNLLINFTGSACDPHQPAAVGCESVTTDPQFKQSLAAFTARMNHNLSYASFFPVVSTGIGVRF